MGAGGDGTFGFETAGKNTLFGSLLKATGGDHGVSGGTTPGTGGVGTLGDINIKGNSGEGSAASGTNIGSGKGGDSILSTRVSGGTTPTGNQFPGAAYGGGGGGATSTSTDIDGGNGASGVIIITEYYS